MIESLIGIAVCGIWACIGYIIGFDEGVRKNDSKPQ